jgi:putative phage-type endonuclease
MKIINTQQGSDEWKNLRLSKITGTDSSILTGSNIWKSKLELWEQKLQIREPDICNEKMKRGNLLEEPARLLLNTTLDIEFNPIVVISDKHPWMMASLDGISHCMRFICEIKCPSLKSHEQAISGVIAEYYKDQMQHCLAVTDCEKCYYCSYFPDHKQEIAIIEIYPDLQKHAEIIDKSYKFYHDLCTMNPPQEWKFKERK